MSSQSQRAERQMDLKCKMKWKSNFFQKIHSALSENKRDNDKFLQLSDVGCDLSSVLFNNHDRGEKTMWPVLSFQLQPYSTFKFNMEFYSVIFW